MNETASEHDIVKYGLREQNQEFGWRSEGPFEWTVDHDREVYLRNMGPCGHEMPIPIAMLFFWERQRIDVNIETIHFVSRQREYAEETVRILPAYAAYKPSSFWLPDSLEELRKKITNDFRDALLVQRDTGTSGYYKKYVFSIEI